MQKNTTSSSLTGRHRAVYETTHCRIPLPLKPLVDQITAIYRYAVNNPNLVKDVASSNRFLIEDDLLVLKALVEINRVSGHVKFDLNNLGSPNIEPNKTNKTLVDASLADSKLIAVKTLLTDWESKKKDTRNWVEAARLLDALKQLDL